MIPTLNYRRIHLFTLDTASCLFRRRHFGMSQQEKLLFVNNKINDGRIPCFSFRVLLMCACWLTTAAQWDTQCTFSTMTSQNSCCEKDLILNILYAKRIARYRTELVTEDRRFCKQVLLSHTGRGDKSDQNVTVVIEKHEDSKIKSHREQLTHLRSLANCKSPVTRPTRAAGGKNRTQWFNPQFEADRWVQTENTNAAQTSEEPPAGLYCY